jgi:hypothetical protein
VGNRVASGETVDLTYADVQSFGNVGRGEGCGSLLKRIWKTHTDPRPVGPIFPIARAGDGLLIIRSTHEASPAILLHRLCKKPVPPIFEQLRADQPVSLEPEMKIKVLFRNCKKISTTQEVLTFSVKF